MSPLFMSGIHKGGKLRFLFKFLNYGSFLIHSDLIGLFGFYLLIRGSKLDLL